MRAVARVIVARRASGDPEHLSLEAMGPLLNGRLLGNSSTTPSCSVDWKNTLKG